MLEAQNVSKHFVDTKSGQSVMALDGVDLAIPDHEFVAIIGPSGCGKTTLLRTFAGLERPDTGSVRLGGQDITGPAPERAMVFQSFALLPWLTVVQNIAFGLHMRGVNKRERAEQARSLAAKVGLEGFEGHFPAQLSGGMQQRVGLARALAVEPQVLLMDEPFGALDEQTKRVLWEELRRVWERDRKTVVFVTHSMDEAIVLADRIVVMTNRPGRIKEIIDVNIPRPRPSHIETAPEYPALKSHMWDLLRVEQEEVAVS
jgi:NitT/TauT family transport system ATP-binding protein